MKKTIGIILLIIAGLNLIAIIARTTSGEQIGSGGYLFTLLILAGGGVYLIQSSNKKSEVEE